ncbi:clathrin light chain [Chytriomyces sp. MP71]|nr:clathrin light chain [Chytriomyces sp. MP71]
MEFANASAVAAGIGEAEAEAEPEAVRAWRDNFELTIADRDARSAAKNEETVRAARESLDRFYAEYNDKKNKTIARNKENEKTALALQESNSGGIWEQVVKQIDTSAKDAKLKEKLKSDGKDEGKKKIAAAAGPKAKDTSRMKSLLISLKADKAAPGAEN